MRTIPRDPYRESLTAIEGAIAAGLASRLSSDGILDGVVELLKSRFPHYSWVGIYRMFGKSELVLGPFRGKPSPHTRIPLDRGICGAAALQKATVIVPDVGADPRYLACSLETKSEIVVPIMRGNECLGEIDIDSDQASAFSPDDKRFLEQIAHRLAPILSRRDD